MRWQGSHTHQNRHPKIKDPPPLPSWRYTDNITARTWDDSIGIKRCAAHAVLAVVTPPPCTHKKTNLLTRGMLCPACSLACHNTSEKKPAAQPRPCSAPPPDCSPPPAFESKPLFPTCRILSPSRPSSVSLAPARSRCRLVVSFPPCGVCPATRRNLRTGEESLPALFFLFLCGTRLAPPPGCGLECVDAWSPHDEDVNPPARTPAGHERVNYRGWWREQRV